MINFDKISALRTGMTIFFVIVITGVLTYSFLPANYKVSVQQITQNENFGESLSPYEFHKILNGESEKFLIVDIRNEEDFESEHFEKSINIPMDRILDKNNIKRLKNSESIIISDMEWKSHSTSLLLQQLGINSMPVNSDYKFIRDNVFDFFNHSKLFFSCEKKAYDYHRFVPVEEAIEIEEIKLNIDDLGGC